AMTAAASSGSAAAHRLPGGLQLGHAADPELAAAVIATARDLEPQREVQRCRALAQRLERPNLTPFRRGDSKLGQEPSLRQPILGHEQREDAWPNGPQFVH